MHACPFRQHARLYRLFVSSLSAFSPSSLFSRAYQNAWAKKDVSAAPFETNNIMMALDDVLASLPLRSEILLGHLVPLSLLQLHRSEITWLAGYVCLCNCHQQQPSAPHASCCTLQPHLWFEGVLRVVCMLPADGRYIKPCLAQPLVHSLLTLSASVSK